MRSRIILLLLIPFFLSFSISSLNAQLSATTGGRIESEFKLSVPDEITEDVWQFLKKEFDTEGIQKIDTAFSAVVAQEIFYDQYFDNEHYTLFQHQAGARFRQRYVADTLAKELLQLKLPLADSTGVAREEIKFNVYTNRKKTDRQAMHPFWRHVRPKNREDVNLHLARFDLTGNDLTPAVKVRQDRQRIYVLKNDVPFLTMTFDEVCSFYFPYPCFTELELELNEILYTDSDDTDRVKMEQINQGIKDKIMDTFPALRQDQTPKYNKMSILLKDNVLEKIYSNLMYIILGFIVAYAGFLFFQNSVSHKQKMTAHANRQ